MTPLLFLAAGGAAVYFYLHSQDGNPPASSDSGAPPQPGKPPSNSGSQITVSKPAPPQEVTGPLTLPPGRWGWPVPRWQDRAPVISDGFRKSRSDHNGVDIMFARLASDPFRVGSPNGTKNFVMPDSWMAVAAADGYLYSSVARSSRGGMVLIDHGNLQTFYGHLQTLFVPEVNKPSIRKDTRPILIKAGQPLGVIGADPSDQEGIKHLHFELWRGFNHPVDPEPLMASWEVFSPKEVSALLDTFPRNARARRTREEPDLVHVTDYWRAKPGRAARP